MLKNDFYFVNTFKAFLPDTKTRIYTLTHFLYGGTMAKALPGQFVSQYMKFSSTFISCPLTVKARRMHVPEADSNTYVH